MPEVQPDTLAVLMAQTIKAFHTAGNLRHAIGLGDPAWDILSAPPTPLGSATELLAEIHRKAPDSFFFVEDVTGTATGGSNFEIIDTARVEANGFFDNLEVEITSGPSQGIIATVITWNLATFTFTFPPASFPDGINATDTYTVKYALASGDSYALKAQTTWIITDTFSDGAIREEGLFIDSADYVFDSVGDFIGAITAGSSTITLESVFYGTVSVGDILELTDISTGNLEFRRILTKDVSDQVTLEGELTYAYNVGDSDTIKRYLLTNGTIINHFRDTKLTKTSADGMLRQIILDFRGA